MKRVALLLGALAIAAGLALDFGAPRLGARAQKPTSARLREGRAIIERARASGLWTAAERDQLHVLLPTLAPEERAEVLRSLALSMNTGEVALRGIGRPL